MKAPRVSVVVTNYNYAPYVEACLDSIANQSLPDFDCVVIDDASTDKSREVIERFISGDAAGGRFTLHPHEKNVGQMAGFRAGLAESQAELVTFVDADDLLLPDFLEVHLRAHLNPYNSVAFTCSDQVQITADGEVVAAGNPTLLREQRDPTRTHQLTEPIDWVLGENRELALRQSPRTPVLIPPITSNTGVWRWSATSAMMFRRTTLELILCEDCDRFRLHADYYLCMFSHVIGGSLIIPTVHGCYRRHGSNAFSSSRIVGSDPSVRDLTKEVSLEAFHYCFVTHLIRNFDSFRSVVDEHQLYMIIARFSSQDLLRTLRDEHPLNQIRLLKCRVTWRIAGLIGWLRSRFFWLRRLAEP